MSPFSRRPSSDTLALAICDPGLRRRLSSDCEEDSLPEVSVDSGLSTLKRSHEGYDSEQEVKGQEEEKKEELKMTEDDNNDSLMGENSDTEVRFSECSVHLCFSIMTALCHVFCVSMLQPAETVDAESAIGSDTSSMLEWKLTDSITIPAPSAPTTKKSLSAISVQVGDGVDDTEWSPVT